MYSRGRYLFCPASWLRRVLVICCLACILWTLSLQSRSWAAEPADGQAMPFVGLVQAPPFAMQDGDGKWTGITVELWQHIAENLGLRFAFREMPVSDLLASVEQGKLLAALTAIATADQELVVDFTHPYYSSGLAIAVAVGTTSGNWFEPLANVASVGTVKLTSVLVGLLCVAGVLVWLFERRANPEHFDPRLLHGITDGLWWAAVTLTTVGYGDKAPRTRAGRVLGVVWMFAAVILIALFTAQVTSSLTVTSLSGRVRGPADLPHVSVGAVQDSPAQAMLRAKLGVRAAGYPGLKEGLEALERGEINAFVAAEPVLRYEIAHAFPARLTVVGSPFLRVDYVFALPLNTPLRKQVNREILAYIETDEWRTLLRQYLGGDQ